MNWFIFDKNRMLKFVLGIIIFVLCFPNSSHAQSDSINEVTLKYEHRIEKYKKRWSNIIPDYTKIQFAGGMGLLSAGIGWDYGNKHWETDLLLGFLPKFSGDEAHATITLKENYIPWKVTLSHEADFSQWMLEPFTVSLYFNKIFGDTFWQKPPKKYPKGYYYAATNLRINLAFGQRINLHFKNPRFSNTMCVFYEVCTNDLYIMCAVQNKTLKLHDIFSLSLGIKFQIL
ncbi:hypothetical protein [Coprobacter secundus]|uniref:hypothetical protein n=2 Tax=Coprobacter secundus TaxID=1501392 RepID=UPI0005735EC6|nr:hypothetical protein [uncultured Coprobacter sp.]KHM44979.1 hypothetical protein PU94_13535 [Coprobacter secundus]